MHNVYSQTELVIMAENTQSRAHEEEEGIKSHNVCPQAPSFEVQSTIMYITF